MNPDYYVNMTPFFLTTAIIYTICHNYLWNSLSTLMVKIHVANQQGQQSFMTLLFENNVCIYHHFWVICSPNLLGGWSSGMQTMVFVYAGMTITLTTGRFFQALSAVLLCIVLATFSLEGLVKCRLQFVHCIPFLFDIISWHKVQDLLGHLDNISLYHISLNMTCV